MRTVITRCVSSNEEATAAALARLAGYVKDFCTTNPAVTLEVSGADGDAAAKKLQEIVATKVTVTKATAAKAGTVVVAKKEDTPVARFHSTTTIVPVVHTPTGGDGGGSPKVEIGKARLYLHIPDSIFDIDISGAHPNAKIPGDIDNTFKTLDAELSASGTTPMPLFDISGGEVVSIYNEEMMVPMGAQEWTGKCEWHGSRACAIQVGSNSRADFDSGRPKMSGYESGKTYDDHVLLCYFTSSKKADWQLDAGSGRFVHYFGTDALSEETIERETGTDKTGAYDFLWYAT